MSRVIAAIDGSAVARAVLATGAAAAELFQSELEAVHVRTREGRADAAAAAAAAAGVALQTLEGPELPTLFAVGREADVRALVVGARSEPAGRRPAGKVALGVIVGANKPVVVVPPETDVPYTLTRILVPLDATKQTAAALRATIELAHDTGVEVVALHVLHDGSLPLFSDQPQHEADAWRHEFLARHAPRPERLRLETRVGVAAEHVRAVAAESGADLIAVGWSQDLTAGRAAVVRALLERSQVPILLLPVEDRRRAEIESKP
jgi:nucleotide-binding universal stress UspA family protein